jgi:GT2 family glycosyltransferase
MPSYTAVGGLARSNAVGVSAILLNREGRYPRRTLFAELEKAGFDYVVSLEGPQDRYDLEDLSDRFPFVKFIILKENIGMGEQINLAVSEIESPLFFVLWNDLRILHGADAAKISAWFLPENGAGRFCTVPVIQTPRLETLPTLTAPALYRPKLFRKSRQAVRALRFPPLTEAQPSLYPFDGVGLYDRERFVRLGGFDRAIGNPYWQLMDLGFRAHLWGEEIRCTQLIRLSYDGEPSPEDATVDAGYRRFYLRNLAPVLRKDTAHVPLRLFSSYYFRTGGGPLAAWEEFKENRKWVDDNALRFKRDARDLVLLWEQEADSGGSPEGTP